MVILKILLLPGAKNRFASYRRAERKLRQLLYAGHVPFLLLTQSGQLKWAAPFIWGQAKAQNWFGCGELVMPLGTKTTVDLGSAVPGLTDDSGLVYVPDGVECKILIPRHWLSPALAPSEEVSSHEATEQQGDAAERGGIVIGDDLSGPGVEAPASAHSEPATTRGIMAVVEAAREIWKPDGIPPVGLHFETRNNMIKDELRKSGRTTSGRTIQRAMVLIETLAASGRNWPQ